LSLHRDQMAWSSDRLLERGLDMSSRRSPRTIPIPLARHPRTQRDARRFEAEIMALLELHDLCFTVTAVGVHVVFSAVAHEDLVEVLSGYVEGYPAEVSREEIGRWVSRSDLESLALACALWLLEPVGEMESRVADLDAACLDRMSYAQEIWTLTSNAIRSRRHELPEDKRLAATNAMAGWSAANLSLTGEAGKELNPLLGGYGVPAEVRYERLYQELPSATLVAWDDRGAEEPLRPTGQREINLTRRVAKGIIGARGNEETLHRGKIVPGGLDAASTEIDARSSEPDQLLEEFELRETLRQQLGALPRWIESAHLSEQEKQVYELDMRTDHDTKTSARELGITENHVRQVRKNYLHKLRKAAGH
jgi:hypothetical protein